MIPGLKKYQEFLILRRYSRQTIRSYLQALVDVFRYLSQQGISDAGKASEADFRGYFLSLTRDRNLSGSAIRIRRYALELFLREIVHRDISLNFVHRLRKDDFLPVIFTREEITRILAVTHMTSPLIGRAGRIRVLWTSLLCHVSQP